MRITDEEPVLDFAVLDVIRRTDEAEFSQQGVVYLSLSDPIPGWATPGPNSFTFASYHAKHVYEFSDIRGFIHVLQFISEPINLKFSTSRKVLVGERERVKIFSGALGMKI